MDFTGNYEELITYAIESYDSKVMVIRAIAKDMIIIISYFYVAFARRISQMLTKG